MCAGGAAPAAVAPVAICYTRHCRLRPPSEDLAMPIVNRVADLHAEISAWRRDLHAHPELQFDVHRTAVAVADKPKSFRCDAGVAGIGRTAVVGVIRGKPGNKVIGLRADMDALPLEEETG